MSILFCRNSKMFTHFLSSRLRVSSTTRPAYEKTCLQGTIMPIWLVMQMVKSFSIMSKLTNANLCSGLNTLYKNRHSASTLTGLDNMLLVIIKHHCCPSNYQAYRHCQLARLYNIIIASSLLLSTVYRTVILEIIKCENLRLTTITGQRATTLWSTGSNVAMHLD